MAGSAHRTIFVTGGTGTLGRELVGRFAGDIDVESVVVLSRSASARVSVSEKVRLVRGNLGAGPTLGMSSGEYAALRERVTDIVHCAAETSFIRPIDEARAVNVEGTRAVLALAAQCPSVQRVACFSTVYVSGRATGCFGEDDVGGGEGFVNSYEQSKAEMEALVRTASAELPVALYRLSTIIGDSRSGVVGGLNAVHHALRLLYQGLAPMIPGSATTPVDLIPVDFAAAAAHHLMSRAFSPGATYHICSGPARSAPLGALIDATIDAFHEHRPAWRKRSIARPALVDLATYELFVRTVEEAGNEVLRQATRAVQAFAYQLAYPKVFDARRAAQALMGTGIEPPPVLDYYPHVIRWCVETNWGAAA